MINPKFETYKVRREIIRSGSLVKFFRGDKNEFNEQSGDKKEVARLLGLYHETNSYVQATDGDAGTNRTKKQPQVLCLYDDVKDLDIQFGDYVEVYLCGFKQSMKPLRYVGMVDIQSWHLIVDLSFEEIDDGS